MLNPTYKKHPLTFRQTQVQTSELNTHDHESHLKYFLSNLFFFYLLLTLYILILCISKEF